MRASVCISQSRRGANHLGLPSSVHCNGREIVFRTVNYISVRVAKGNNPRAASRETEAFFCERTLPANGTPPSAHTNERFYGTARVRESDEFQSSLRVRSLGSVGKIK